MRSAHRFQHIPTCLSPWPRPSRFAEGCCLCPWQCQPGTAPPGRSRCWAQGSLTPASSAKGQPPQCVSEGLKPACSQLARARPHAHAHAQTHTHGLSQQPAVQGGLVAVCLIGGPGVMSDVSRGSSSGAHHASLSPLGASTVRAVDPRLGLSHSILITTHLRDCGLIVRRSQERAVPPGSRLISVGEADTSWLPAVQGWRSTNWWLWTWIWIKAGAIRCTPGSRCSYPWTGQFSPHAQVLSNNASSGKHSSRWLV